MARKTTTRLIFKNTIDAFHKALKVSASKRGSNKEQLYSSYFEPLLATEVIAEYSVSKGNITVTSRLSGKWLMFLFKLHTPHSGELTVKETRRLIKVVYLI